MNSNQVNPQLAISVYWGNHQMISLLRNYVNQLHWCSELTTAYLASSPSANKNPSTWKAEENTTKQVGSD